MRRVLALVMIALLAALPALAEIDVTTMTDEELVALRDATQAEIDRRAEAATAEVVKTEMGESDFLSDRERYDRYRETMSACDFSGLLEMANDYIETFHPAESDSVYAVLRVLKSIDADLDLSYLDIDDFDGTSVLRFTGCDAISETVCVAPYIEDGDLWIRYGFIAEDWVFFDTIEISADRAIIKDDTYGYRYDIQNDVLDGGDVREMLDDMPEEDEDFYQTIRDSDTVVIRFSREGRDEHYDHVMADVERNAIVGAWNIDSAMTEINSIANAAYRQYFK